MQAGLLRRHEIGEYAVGIGNAGGGWLIMGVSDTVPRDILPVSVPSVEELTRIRESVADSTQIRITLKVVPTPQGSVVLAHIPSRPKGVIFHTRDGKYLIRLDDKLRGMTLSEIDTIRREAGEELTATILPDSPSPLLSAIGMEELRRLMVEGGAPAELTALPDKDLLRSMGVLTPEGNLLVAGLLLVGKPDAIRANVPFSHWQFFRMTSEADYDQSEPGTDCLPVALRRLRELAALHNPIVTIPGWLIHPEFPRYPVLALRELLVNALVHRDYAAPGSVMLKVYASRLEISNPGGFVGGVTPRNILHHPSAPRYPTLFQALARIRLANAANLGVPRVYRDLLREGKEPPAYWTSGHAVRVTLKGQEPSRGFLELVQSHTGLDVDHLLVIHYLTRHREIVARTASELCQRSLDGAREILGELVNRWKLLEAGGRGARALLPPFPGRLRSSGGQPELPRGPAAGPGGAPFDELGRARDHADGSKPGNMVDEKAPK